MRNQNISVFGPKNNFVEYIRWWAAFLRSFVSFDTHIVHPAAAYPCVYIEEWKMQLQYILLHIEGMVTINIVQLLYILHELQGHLEMILLLLHTNCKM